MNADKPLLKAALLLCLIGLCGCGSAEVGQVGGAAVFPAPEDTTSHDNHVSFSLINIDNSAMAFSETGHRITDGQPWNGVTTNTQNDGWFTIDVNCGRKGSSYVLGWFGSIVQNGPIINALGPPKPEPTSMNFAVSGILSIKGNHYNICLGQWGHEDHNTWYLGGADFLPPMQTPDGKYYITSGASDDVFVIAD